MQSILPQYYLKAFSHLVQMANIATTIFFPLKSTYNASKFVFFAPESHNLDHFPLCLAFSYETGSFSAAVDFYVNTLFACKIRYSAVLY